MPPISTFSDNALSSPIIINHSQPDNVTTSQEASEEEIPDEVAQAIAMIECAPSAAAAVAPFSNITNTIIESPPLCYSRLCGLMRRGQGSRQKINLRQQSIADFDESELYNLRDPTPSLSGQHAKHVGGLVPPVGW